MQVGDVSTSQFKLEYLNGRGRAILLEQYERGEEHFPIKAQLELIKKHQGSSLCIILDTHTSPVLGYFTAALEIFQTLEIIPTSPRFNRNALGERKLFGFCLYNSLFIEI